MKNLIFLALGVVMLGLFACEKEAFTEQAPAVEALRRPPSSACSAALMIQGMTPASSTCSVTDLTTGLNVVTFANGTAYLNLLTNRSYFVDIQGPSPATFTWCTCGDVSGSTVIPAGGFFVLNTGSNPANYTICSF